MLVESVVSTTNSLRRGDLDAEVHPHERDAGVRRGGRERQRRRLAGVEPDSRAGDSLRNRPLVPVCHSFRDPSPSLLARAAPFRAIDMPITRKIGGFAHVAPPFQACEATGDSWSFAAHPLRASPRGPNRLPECARIATSLSDRHGSSPVSTRRLIPWRSTDESSARDPSQGRPPHRTDADRHLRARRGERRRVPVAAAGGPRGLRVPGRRDPLRDPDLPRRRVARRRPAAVHDPDEHVPARGLAAPRLQHALALDLREQRRGRARADALRALLRARRDRRGARADGRVRGVGGRARADGRGVGRDRGRTRGLPRPLPRARAS